MSKRSLRTLLAILSCLVLSFSVTQGAQANNSTCLNTPSLSDSRLVTKAQLGNGTIASAWQWYPGSDSSSVGLSNLGTKVSVVTGNLRSIDFGLLHWGIPDTADLRMLSYTSFDAKATINGDFLDANGPWNAMIENSEMIYAPTGSSSVLGMVNYKVNPARGYRSKGYVKFGNKLLAVTGVNQFKPGRDSVVIYKADYLRDATPKGQATVVFRGSKIIRIYPNGYAALKSSGTVVQVSGKYVSTIKSLLKTAKVTLSLPPAPSFETRMAADNLTAFGSISNTSTTLNFDSINFAYLSSSGATLFDSDFRDTTRAGRVTLRIQQDVNGNYVVKNVYRQGYFTKVGSSEFIVQANGPAATIALKFKAGDFVSISRGYRAQNRSNYISAGGKGARLLQGGKFVWVCDIHNKDYRPRTAIGWNEDGQIWLITSSRGFDAADMGMRQGGSSSDQMGHWLQNLGATEAFLLDGGGSTTMEINLPDQGWQRFDLPDGAWYRGLSNAYAITSKN